jgi:arylsulfatase A-like enzyme
MIDRRSFLGSLGGASLSLASTAGRALGAPSRKKLNVLFILADDLGYGDLGIYGSPGIRTPNIDSIGGSGVKFTQFYSNAPECTPTRSALMSGEYQQRFGGLECAIGIGNVGRYDEAIWLQKRDELGLPPSVITLPRILKRSGYDTALIGKWHLGYLPKFSPNKHGFDEFFGILGGNADYFTHKEESDLPCFYHNDRPIQEDGYLTDLLTEHAVGWLKQRSKNPFFLYLPYTCPHLPLEGPEDNGKPPENSSHDRYRRMIERMDRGIGEVLAQVDRMGEAENTLVIFMSDNGAIKVGRNTPFRGFKSSLWEGGIRMPCLARLPGVLKPDTTITQVGLGMDWLPTILAAAGIRVPAGKRLDGVNLLPVLKGESAPFSRTVFWRYKRLEARRKAVRAGDWKYVWDTGKEELHNLAEDPGETKDLLAERAELAAELKKTLAAWELDVRAPRLRDFVSRQ